MQKKNSNAIIDGTNKLIDLRRSKSGITLLRICNLIIWIVFAAVIYFSVFAKKITGSETLIPTLKIFFIYVLAFPMYVALIFDAITFMLIAYADSCDMPLKVQTYDIRRDNSHIYKLFRPFILFAGKHIMSVRTYFLHKMQEDLEQL